MKNCKECKKNFLSNHKSRIYCNLKCQKSFNNRLYWPRYAKRYPDRLRMHWINKERPYLYPAYEKYGKFCKMCKSVEKIDVHHIKPKQYGGTDELENLVILCRLHHLKAHATIRKAIKPLVSSFNFKELFPEFG